MSKSFFKNFPNLLTFLRIAMLPLLITSFYISNFLAFGIFVFASLTDFFDGYLARVWNAQSVLGTFLDPIADKLIVITALIMLVYTQKIDQLGLLPTIIIIWREIFTSGLREFMSAKNIQIPVNKIGKFKTALQMIAILLLIAFPASSYGNFLGQIALASATVLSIISCFQYCAKNISYFYSIH